MVLGRRLVLGPGSALRWVCLHVQPIGDRWSAMLVDEGEPAPGPGELKGVGVFGETAEEAEQTAKVYLGLCAPAN